MRYLVNRSGNIFGDFDRVLGNLFDDNIQSRGVRPFRTPAVDISEDKSSYILDIELPGVSEKDVDVKIEKNRLVVSSVQKKEKENRKDSSSYLLKERQVSEFYRSFILPKDADPESVEGVFSNGILTVTIKKKQEEQARSIKIKAA